jgi:hypothetical protein
MFITDKIIYIQMNKTACTHIAALLSKHIGGKQIGKHNWLENFNTKKFICGSIRNPWDWYISLWAFGCKGEGAVNSRVSSFDPDKFWSLIFSKLQNRYGPYLNGNYSYKDLISNIKNEIGKPKNLWKKSYKDNTSAEGFRKWIKLMYNPKRKMDYNEGFSESSISKFAGIMTYRYCYFFHKDFFLSTNFKGIKSYDDLHRFDLENNILDYMIKLETLENDFIEMLEKFGYNISNETKTQIKNSGKTNVSSHLGSSHYYDEETIKLVAENERLIIDKYGYKPPSLK